ncbi:MAG TPA: MFS transporter [Solirubrobacteraceae bacterium]|nr:MFS transporter [Solirubrobacteraceae bacterium]
MTTTVGGPARLRVIALLAAVLGLNTADSATVGSIASELEPALHISNPEIGLLVAVTTGIGAIATLPVGVLADRVNRVRLLWISILVWSAGMIVNGLSVSFAMLLLSRLALGAVVATAGPATSSLTGDYFGRAERGRIWGYILSGELLGTGIGFLVSGNLASVATWRAGFIWLAAPGLVLAWAIRRHLPEPARGGQSRLVPGETRIRPVRELEGAAPGGGAEPPGEGDADAPREGDADAPREGADAPWEGADAQPEREPEPVVREVEREEIAPDERLVLHEDPTGRPLWWAVRHVLSIPTNRALIIASALGYYFLQGLQTFAVLFLRSRFGLGQSAASTILVVLGAGAIIGVLVAGQLGDRLIARGRISARPVIGGVALLVAVALFLPALLISSLVIAAPLFFVAAAGLGGSNSPLDAARLDIMHSRLWGRAEAVRTVLRTSLQAIAPLAFGYVSAAFGGRGASFAQTSSPRSTTALDRTFLIMLVPLVVAGVLLLVRARMTYPRDIATAAASERATEPTRRVSG